MKNSSNNIFLENLETYYKGQVITEDIFKETLKDEEYLEDEYLKRCFCCENNNLETIIGSRDVYTKILSANMLFKTTHYYGLLCNFLNNNGIPIFKGIDEYPNLKLTYCTKCGKPLRVFINKWRYPYLDYLNEPHSNIVITQEKFDIEQSEITLISYNK